MLPGFSFSLAEYARALMPNLSNIIANGILSSFCIVCFGEYCTMFIYNVKFLSSLEYAIINFLFKPKHK